MATEQDWIALTKKRPRIGEWVLMYLTKYGGCDRYRAGLHMGPDDWMSAANFNEPTGLLKDSDVSYWMPLPAPPVDAVDESPSSRRPE